MNGSENYQQETIFGSRHNQERDAKTNYRKVMIENKKRKEKEKRQYVKISVRKKIINENKKTRTT